MDIQPIRTKKDYKKNLKRIDEIIDANPGTPEYDELEIISILVADYEDKHYPIDPPDPIAAIKFRMEQQGLKQTDVIYLFGSRSRASEVLSKKRGLTLKMIRNLHKHLGIPLKSLVQI